MTSSLTTTRRSLLATAGALALAPHAHAAAPQRGGHLRLGLAGGSTSDTLDPQPWADTVMAVIGYATRGNLTEVAADGSLRGEIAESWEGSDGARTWRFHLRRGATFSNGKSVTAEDAVASLNLHRREASRSGAKVVFNEVTDIRAEDQHTVAVTLSAGNLDFPTAVANTQLNIMPSADGEPDWRSGIGAGPYILEAFEPGVRAVFRRNPNSYKSGHVDSAELTVINDVVARQSALISGRVDVINRPDLRTVGLLGRRPDLRVERKTGRLYYSLTQDVRADPFANVEVRRALKYGLDREAILRTIFNGFGAVGNDQPITPDYPFHDASLAARAYDPDRARFHLRKAGLETVTARLHVSDAAFNGAVDLAVLYQQQAARAGITLDIRREPPDGYWANTANFTWYATYYSGRPTEDGILSIIYGAGSPWNRGNWVDPRLNELLVQARVEADEARRRAQYQEIQHIASEDGTTVIPIFAQHVWATTAKVQHGEHVSGAYELDGQRLVERWWLA